MDRKLSYFEGIEKEIACVSCPNRPARLACFEDTALLYFRKFIDTNKPCFEDMV